MNNTNTNHSLRIFAKGHTISNNDLATRLNNNDLIIGGSGSGKTTGYCIPNIRQCYGSMVISDTKGSLYKKLRRELKDNGYTVRCLDLVNLENSCIYNPLSFIRTDAEGHFNEKDVITLSRILVPHVSKNDPFWDETARLVISFLIGFTLEAFDKSEHNLGTVLELYKLLLNPHTSSVFERYAAMHPDSFATSKYMLFRDLRTADRTWSCVCGFVSRALDIFEFKDMRRVIGADGKFYTNTLSFKELATKKTALFLNVSDTDHSMDTFANIFYAQAFNQLFSIADSNPNNRLRVPVRIMLDDFAAGTYIEDFDKIISVTRSRGISVSIILQSLSQLNTLYTQSQSDTILNNCDHILYLGSQDLTTANYIGIRTCKSQEKILSLDTSKAVLITKGQRGMIVDKITPDMRQSELLPAAGAEADICCKAM